MRQFGDGSTAVLYSNGKISITQNAVPAAQIAEWRAKAKRTAGLQMQRLRKTLNAAALRILAGRSAAIMMYEKAHRVEKQQQPFVHRPTHAPAKRRQKGGSSRSSAKSGDSNGDPDPDDALVPDHMASDPRILEYGETDKSSFRLIRKAIFGFQIKNPSSRQRAAINFYTEAFCHTVRVLLNDQKFAKLDIDQKQDAEQGITVFLLQKLASKHDFQKNPNPNIKKIFFSYFWKPADVLEKTHGSKRLPTCPLAIYERAQKPTLPKLRETTADVELQAAEIQTKIESTASGYTFVKAIPSEAFRMQRREVKEQAHRDLQDGRKKSVKQIAFAGPTTTPDDAEIDAIDALADDSLRPDYLYAAKIEEKMRRVQEAKIEVEIAPVGREAEGDGKPKLNLPRDYFPHLCDLDEEKLRERLPTIIKVLSDFGFTRGDVRSLLATRAIDKFGKYPNQEKYQLILDIFDQVPTQRPGKGKKSAGGVA
ncbi:hypothetical protein [Acidithiobacillus thiooxidans]|uniref:hypothetical protein n=1 Tax=Acidithiobacillus thiooxidans TaxID=930 RepID=UPI00111217A6|nr:hypothetical protein [Acidithiobacillus thiooxidans]